MLVRNTVIVSQSWIFRIHIEVSDDFNILSMYTPLNPLDIQANKMAARPIMEDWKLYGLEEGDSEPLFAGHCGNRREVTGLTMKCVLVRLRVAAPSN